MQGDRLILHCLCRGFELGIWSGWEGECPGRLETGEEPQVTMLWVRAARSQGPSMVKEAAEKAQLQRDALGRPGTVTKELGRVIRAAVRHGMVGKPCVERPPQV